MPFPELFSQPCQIHSSILWHADNNIVITNVWDYWYDQSTGFTKDCKDWPGDAWRHLVNRTNNYTLKSLIGKKKIGKHISIHYFITFLGKHSNVNNVINALLLLCTGIRG